MSNCAPISVQQSIQIAFDECLESLQATFASYGHRISAGNDKLPQTAPLPKFEDPLSPSSDEGGSIGFGSPLLMNEERNNNSLDIELFGDVHTSFKKPENNFTQKFATHGDNTNEDLNITIVSPVPSPPTNHIIENHTILKPNSSNIKTRSFALPDIEFSGSILNSNEKKNTVSVPEMVTEGLDVEKFLDEFKYHIKLSSVNIEEHWYGLLEICFKNVRENRMNLYLWFKKRLHEGLSWSNAQEIIKRQLGFYSENSKQILKKALNLYRKGPLETFEEYYKRFQSYALACKLLSLHSDNDLIYQFIYSFGRDKVYYFLSECLNKQLLVKKNSKTLPLPEIEYIVTSSPKEELKLSVLSKVFSSWNEFDTTVLIINFKKLCAMDHETMKEKSKRYFTHNRPPIKRIIDRSTSDTENNNTRIEKRKKTITFA